MKPTSQIGRDTKWPVSAEDTMQTIVQNGTAPPTYCGLSRSLDLRFADNECCCACTRLVWIAPHGI